VGGTHQIAHALQRYLCSHGGEFWVLSPVKKVIVENGRATGIQLEDGTKVEAKHLVVSNLHPVQTISLIEEHVSSEIKDKVKKIDSSGSCLYWGSIALHEPPKYKLAEVNPDVVTFRSYVLTADDFYFRYKMPAEIFSQGYASIPDLHPYHQSTFDPTRAPKGKYELHFELYAPPARYYTLKEWLKKKEEVFENLLKWWQRFAPNMTWDNIIAVHFNTPYETQMKNSSMFEGCRSQITECASQSDQYKPIPELAGARTPIKNLYLSSVSNNPKGAVLGASGYICYKVIAEDFNLIKVWEKAGRPY